MSLKDVTTTELLQELRTRIHGFLGYLDAMIGDQQDAVPTPVVQEAEPAQRPLTVQEWASRKLQSEYLALPADAEGDPHDEEEALRILWEMHALDQRNPNAVRCSPWEKRSQEEVVASLAADAESATLVKVRPPVPGKAKERDRTTGVGALDAAPRLIVRPKDLEESQALMASSPLMAEDPFLAHLPLSYRCITFYGSDIDIPAHPIYLWRLLLRGVSDELLRSIRDSLHDTYLYRITPDLPMLRDSMIGAAEAWREEWTGYLKARYVSETNQTYAKNLKTAIRIFNPDFTEKTPTKDFMGADNNIREAFTEVEARPGVFVMPLSQKIRDARKGPTSQDTESGK